MNKYLLYLLIFILSILFVYLVGGQVIIIASLLVIFDKCLLGRVKIISGIEFTTISIIIVAMKYEPLISVLFCIFIPSFLPSVINSIIGEKWIVNKNFKLTRSSFGMIINIIYVFIVFYLRGYDILFIMFIILLFNHAIYYLKIKLTQTSFAVDYLGIIIHFLFNLSLVYFFHPFLLQLVI